MNLKLALKRDCHEALSMLTERVRVYENKIKSYEARCVFKIQNARFELFRRRFYRKLTKEQPVSHNVRAEEIREFWAATWNSKMGDDDNRHNESAQYVVPI
ncbi:unnamed protein product [Thelazia callipaeda]|uniref:Transposase n=1 Tax=Thelazia callipaeda TaxID=103827 RepID=A0A0N5D7E2_THECL|nr:unnamed protein product [Thelazia callipaeda]